MVTLFKIVVKCSWFSLYCNCNCCGYLANLDIARKYCQI